MLPLMTPEVSQILAAYPPCHVCTARAHNMLMAAPQLEADSPASRP
jgi:hypothetical protein